MLRLILSFQINNKYLFSIWDIRCLKYCMGNLCFYLLTLATLIQVCFVPLLFKNSMEQNCLPILEAPQKRTFLVKTKQNKHRAKASGVLLTWGPTSSALDTFRVFLWFCPASCPGFTVYVSRTGAARNKSTASCWDRSGVCLRHPF